MFKRLIARKITAFEAEWSYPVDYLREVLELSPWVLKRFVDATRIGEYRVGISKPAHFCAKILTVLADDCGPCVQLVVDMALRDGVAPEHLASLVSGELHALPDDMRLPAEFTRALLEHSDELEDLREQMREKYGTPGLVSVAYAVIGGRAYPTLKYALGHGRACAPIEVGGLRVIPNRPLRQAA